MNNWMTFNLLSMYSSFLKEFQYIQNYIGELYAWLHVAEDEIWHGLAKFGFLRHVKASKARDKGGGFIQYHWE